MEGVEVATSATTTSSLVGLRRMTTLRLRLGATATVRATGEHIVFNAVRFNCDRLEVRVVSRWRVKWIAASDLRKEP
jgi:hypothetical protein